MQSDVYEETLYIKVYYNIDFWQNRVRIGLGDGISYTNSTFYFEKQEALRKNDHNSRLLNYCILTLEKNF